MKEGYSYEEAESEWPQLRTQMNEQLLVLEGLMQSDNCMGAGGEYSWEDVLVVPELRTLQCHSERIEWPAKLQAYVDKALKDANVPDNRF